jgi:hypothetical protein
MFFFQLGSALVQLAVVRLLSLSELGLRLGNILVNC